jgi:hypothetical protein
MILNFRSARKTFRVPFQDAAIISTDQHVLFHRIYPEEKHPDFSKDVRATAD